MKRIFFFSLMISAAVLASCGGKVIVDGLPPGAGGAGTGGAGGTTTNGSTGSSKASSNIVGSTGSTGPGQGSTGSGSVCDPNYHCAEAITPPNGNPKLLCPGSMSNNLYQALLKCSCGGPCAAACAASSCLGQMATASCLKCVQDPAGGCGNEFKACANDL